MDENQNGVDYGMDPVNNGNVNQQSTPYNDVVGQSTSGSNGLAIASLVCGILSIIGGCCFACIGYVLSILAIILGCFGKGKADKTGKKLATAGLICGIVGFVLSVILSVLGFLGYYTVNYNFGA